MSNDVHITFSARKDCFNVYESYGEICVGCGCCSNDKIKRTKARLELYERMLDDEKRFDNWFFDDPDIFALQKKNHEINLIHYEKKVEHYKKMLQELQEEQEAREHES